MSTTKSSFEETEEASQNQPTKTKEVVIIDLAALDNDDEDMVKDVITSSLPDCFITNRIEDFPESVQDQLRLELMTKTKFCHL